MNTKTLFRSLPLALLTTLLGGAASAELLYLSESSNGQVNTYIDTASIRRNGRFVWYTYEMVERDYSGNPINYLRATHSADCSRRVYRQRDLMTYIFEGVTINEYQNFGDSEPLIAVIPGSIGSAVFTYACSR